MAEQERPTERKTADVTLSSLFSLSLSLSLLLYSVLSSHHHLLLSGFSLCAFLPYAVKEVILEIPSIDVLTPPSPFSFS
jgi:hypothetical protein